MLIYVSLCIGKSIPTNSLLSWKLFSRSSERKTHPSQNLHKVDIFEKVTKFEEVFLLVLKCQNKEGDVRLLWPSQKTSTLIAFSQEIDSHHSFYISSSIFYLTLN